MKRIEQHMHNNTIINEISSLLVCCWCAPSYRVVCNFLNENEFKSSVGNSWTERGIYRMLQRNGYSGLWGLKKSV